MSEHTLDCAFTTMKNRLCDCLPGHKQRIVELQAYIAISDVLLARVPACLAPRKWTEELGNLVEAHLENRLKLDVDELRRVLLDVAYQHGYILTYNLEKIRR